MEVNEALTASRLVLWFHWHVAQKDILHDVPPLDGIHVAEDGVVAESHSASQDFWINGTTLFDSY